MKTQQIWEHLKRKYSDGEAGATFLMEVYNQQSRLLTLETKDAIRQVLQTPICTGVLFGELSRDYRERNGCSQETKETGCHQIQKGEPLQRDVTQVREALSHLENHWNQGQIEGTPFCLTYAENTFLLASMKREGPLLDRLVAACSHFVEYGPFCKYTDLGGIQTYEWDKVNPHGRYLILLRESKKDLTRLKK